MRTRRKRGTVLAVGAVVAGLLWLYNDIAPTGNATSGTSELDELIRDLPATTAAEQAALAPSYDRDAQFGAGWRDLDHNGCDTRQDVLLRDRDGGHPNPSDRCVVVGLVLDDPYTGRTLHGARAIQIDHVVPLAVAWRSGAAAWTQDRRRAFANDPGNLLAVDGPANQEKGDQTPDEWMPPNRSAWCDYLTRYIQVSSTYHLAVTVETRHALSGVADYC